MQKWMSLRPSAARRFAQETSSPRSVSYTHLLVLRLARWTELMKACMQGITDMVPMIVIVFAAYIVRDSLIAIGMPEYVLSLIHI